MDLRKITDRDLIVFLVSKGFEIVKAQKDPTRNRSIIYFHDTMELKKSILGYVNKTERINISDYIAAEKRVKTLFYLQKSS